MADSGVSVECRACGRRLGVEVEGQAVPASVRVQCPRCKAWMVVSIALFEEKTTRLRMSVSAAV